METIEDRELQEILTAHKLWIQSAHCRGQRADFRNKNLRGVGLDDADLDSAMFQGADLCGVWAMNANFASANFSGANLEMAKVQGSCFSVADFSRANLNNAGFDESNLECAILTGATMENTRLQGANLHGTNLPRLTRVIYGEKYFLFIYKNKMLRAGCQNHTIEEWRTFSEADIYDMDGQRALQFYPRLLDIIDFYCGKGDRPYWVK